MPQQQSKRERQKERRAAQRAAVLAARKRRARRRLLARVVLLLILAGGIVAAVLSLLGDDEEDVATQDTTTSTTAAPPMESAAGKPCVPVADPLPIGAPAVPVKVGPPPTELVKEDLKVGTGPAVAQGATITVNYIGVACSTGRIFDSSFARGQPATLPLTGVIAGWQEGIPGMNVGGQRLLVIPAHKGYGQNGRPPSIAPGETLWFVVEVVSVA